MQLKHDGRLAELCSRALSETDPQELSYLLEQINEVLQSNILSVQAVVSRCRELRESAFELSAPS